jgi:hypothetical protein
MYYEISISLLGSHYFATAPRSITTLDKLSLVYAELAKAFPAQRGYKLSISRVETTGSEIDIDTIINLLNLRNKQR